MDVVLCAVLLLLVVASGHHCPLGFEPDCSGNEVRKCKCRNDLSSFIKCDEEKQQLHLQIGYCMWTYNDTNMTVVIAECPYIHPSARNSSMFPLPPNMTASEVNSYMCGEMNRTGRLCGRCKNGTGPSMFSPDLKCVKCLDSSYGWAVYLAAEFIPVTVFVLLVILFRIRLCADYINALVFFCNITSAGLLSYRPGYVYHSNLERNAASILLSVYDIINLKFFQNFFPPLCISEELTSLEVIALRYLVALYPLLLIVVIFALVCLYDRNFKPLVLVWRPFSAIISCFRKQFNVKHSLIHAFASFFLLSFFNFTVTSVSLLDTAIILKYNDGREKVSLVFFWDGSIEYDLSISTSILDITILVVFIILPTVLLLAYPTRTFQKCLNCCGLRCLPLHIFMDAFQGCYKNGTDGTRDYRYFAGLYLFFRYFICSKFLFYFLIHNQGEAVFILVFSFSFALCRPYKNNCFNVVDCLFHAILVLGVFLLFSSVFSSASVTERYTFFLLLCTPLVYLIILTGFFLFSRCILSII